MAVEWRVAGAERVQISNADGHTLDVDGADLGEGAASLPAGAQGELTLTAWKGEVSSRRNLHLSMTEGPRIARWTASPPAVSLGPDETATVRLQWAVEAADEVEILAFPGGKVDLAGQGVPEGAVEVPVSSTTSFRLDATNPQGATFRTIEVDVAARAQIVAFDVHPARIAPGEEVEVQWSTAHTVEVRLERDGELLESEAGPRSGSWRGVVEGDATFTLIGINRLGDEVRAQREVTVGPPQVISFTSSTPIAAPGGTVEVAWENAGGRSLQVRDEAGEVVCTVTSVAEVARGGCTLVAAAALGPATYELEVVNGVGESATASTSVWITDGPVIEEFTATPDRVTEGEMMTFAWRTRVDPLGRVPELALEDDLGGSFDLGGGHPTQGSVSLPLRDVGERTFTLTASTQGTTPWRETATVEVVGVPTIQFTATPAFVDTSESPTTSLQWQTVHGARLRLYRTAGGAPVGQPLVDVTDPAVVALGSHDVTPTALPSESFRLEVDNALGHTSRADVTVEVDPARVDDFFADRLQLVRGEATTLSWITSRADTVTLLTEVDAAAGAWLPDPTESDTATLIYAGGTGDSFVAFDFPDGFSFPWGGVVHESARVSTLGFLSFDMESEVNPWLNQPFPVSHAPNVHLAPFWDYLRSGGVGTIWMDLLEDEQGPALVVSWRNFLFEFSDASSQTDLNFGVVLREDGQFEFRYGTMTSAGTTTHDHPMRANGGSATIGYQAPDGSHRTISFDTVVAEGLSHRTWAMPGLELPASGSRAFAPHVSARFHLEAKNGHSAQAATIDVEVVAPARILEFAVEPAEPEPGEPFELTWVAEEAVALQVRRDDGQILCNAATEELEVGRCAITEPTAGAYVYELHAQGPLARNTDVRARTVVVGPPLRIDTFGLAEESVRKGEGTTLTWATTNAEAVTILADGQPLDLGPTTPLGGSVDVAPLASTVYELVATSMGRERREEVELVVRLASVDEITLSTQQVTQGQGATLTWATDAQRAYANPPLALDVSQTSTYVDIRTSPTAQVLANIVSRYTDEILTFPAGFSFPFFGEEKTQLKVFHNGLASFDLVRGGAGNFRPFPSVENKSWHLAPFHVNAMEPTSGKGGVVWDLQTVEGQQALIVQWHDLQFVGQAAPLSELHFQMLLFEDGAIEYRYGVMQSDVDPSLARGATALIGAQDVDGRVGATISLEREVAGGLQGRAFRIATVFPANGSAQLAPTASTDYVICVQSDDYTECDSVRLVVVEPGDLLFSELQIAPSGGANDQWIEVRNVAPDPIDLEGMTLSTSAGDSHAISTSLLLQPGEFAVLAASDAVVTPSYVYGPALPLPTGNGGITLSSGGLNLATAVWGGSVPVTPGASLALDGIRHVRGAVSVDDPAAWCTSTQTYAGGDRGSPGTPGTGCMSSHYDVDYYSQRPFIDIRATGTSLPELHGTPNRGQIPGGLAFTMPYFGGTITDIWVVTNGVIYLGAPTTNPIINWTLGVPVRGKPDFGLIAPYFSYLVRQPGADFLYETRTAQNGLRVTILQWDNYKRRITQDPDAHGKLTFQAQLWENGDIVFAYQPMEGDPFLYAGGAGTTIGIEAPTNAPAVEYLYNQPLLQRGGQVMEFRWKAAVP